LQCEIVEYNDELLNNIANSFREICKLRAEVEPVAVGSLPNDGKIIDDIRQYD